MSTDLQIDPALRAFVADELLPGLDLEPDRFWAICAALQERFAGRIGELLARRDELQAQVDAWHREHGAGDVAAYEAFLTEIGYLLPLASPQLRVGAVDPEIAEIPGPQLVVPATVPRYALNAANARWGSLFDALYGTDALPARPRAGPRLRRASRRPGDRRGRPAARRALPAGRRQPRRRHRLPVVDGALAVDTAAGATGLADPAQFAGHRAATARRSRCCCAATACTSS